MSTIQKKPAAVAANGAKRQCVESRACPLTSILHEECILSVLQFLHFSDLNDFAVCSQQCNRLRKKECLDQTRQARIIFKHTKCVNGILHALNLFESQGRFGPNRKHLRIDSDCLEGMTRPPMNVFVYMTVGESLQDVTSLDVSRRRPAFMPVEQGVFTTLALLFPNLKTLDMSRANVSPKVVESFSRNCPHLESIKWDGTTCPPLITGQDFKACFRLKEVSFEQAGLWDGVQIKRVRRGIAFDKPKLLCHHYQRLERVNVKRARLISPRKEARFLSQDMLKTFVRSSPRLVWFKSDCTPETIAILRAERPEIVFC